MTLLTEVMERPLDGGYAEAARRKQALGRAPARWSWAFVLVTALVLGLGVTWGVRVLRTPVEADERARASLERNAETARQEVTELSERFNELTVEVAELRSAALGDPAAAAAARDLAAAVGALPVTGSGLVVAVTPDAAAVAEGNHDARIRSGDIRVIVGALRQAGAEAVAVGGVRLTARSAIRDVGDQIQVGFEPLAAPYAIEAIGLAAALEVSLASGRSGDRVSLLRGYLGATVSISRVDVLELAASKDVNVLRYATRKG
jgi:uncharacterized protein YlxW (UPF0749 family)